MDNNQNQTNQNQTNQPKYKNGEKYQYNRFEDTFGDAGRYSDKTPRKEPFHMFKLLPNGEKWKKRYIVFLVVIGLVILVGGIFCALSFNGLI